ncbi:MAG: 3-isopropylmalate dehydrogenase [Gammaproteobacteria bacterium]|nr:3-isopropylmalate dehydrogenase [Gammaproteobacteria bacterium]
MSHKIAVLPGDGIGLEVVAQAIKVIECLRTDFGLDVEHESAPIGGTAFDQHGDPLPESTLALARQADAIVLGAVGGPRWDQVARESRPERGLLRLRAELDLFANLRPALLFAPLAAASTLRPEVVAGLDLLIVRELTGGIYFGKPRGIDVLDGGERRGFNTLVYRESEIERIAHVAFKVARRRGRRVCSVDKANVLECSELWREVVGAVGDSYSDVELTHMYVDNAAMQLVRAPTQFDVIVTSNMFGDILSDEASMLTGSIGMLPSASLDERDKGLYEPVHGSAPDIAGTNRANPLATLLSLAMCLRYSLRQAEHADRVEAAVAAVLAMGLRTADIAAPGERVSGTAEMGDAVVEALRAGAG